MTARPWLWDPDNSARFNPCGIPQSGNTPSFGSGAGEHPFEQNMVQVSVSEEQSHLTNGYSALPLLQM